MVAPLHRLTRNDAKSSGPPSSDFRHVSTRLLIVLTMLPMALATFALFLQWQGSDITDPKISDKLYNGDKSNLPGWQVRPGTGSVNRGNVANCAKSHQPVSHFPHLNGWRMPSQSNQGPKLCITTTTAAGLDQVLPWLFYHKALGVHTFLLFVEGKAATLNSTAVLEAIPGVKIIFRTPTLEQDQAKSRIWNETWLAPFFFKPCNYELFVKQSLNMEMAIVLARAAGMDWIFHIDTDELLYPAGAEGFSLQTLLGEVEDGVDTVVFPNYESAIERDDITDPFSEVSMFKKNYDHVNKEVYFALYKEATRNNPNYFLTYGNGKSAARIVDHLRPNGAHRWHNYARNPSEVKFPEAAVLHFTYAKFSDLTSRRDRCGCKPNSVDVQKCFMLDFDRAAFIIASTQSQEALLLWYREHVVWTNAESNRKLLKAGLFARIYTPQVLVKGILNSGMIEEALRKGALILQGLSSSSRPTPPNHKASDLTTMREMVGGEGLEAELVRSRVGRGDGGDKESSSRKMLSIGEIGEVGVVGGVAMPPMPAPSL